MALNAVAPKVVASTTCVRYAGQKRFRNHPPSTLYRTRINHFSSGEFVLPVLDFHKNMASKRVFASQKHAGFRHLLHTWLHAMWKLKQNVIRCQIRRSGKGLSVTSYNASRKWEELWHLFCVFTAILGIAFRIKTANPPRIPAWRISWICNIRHQSS